MVTVLQEQTKMSSFLEFFGFENDPFPDNLNLDYYFKSESNEQAFYKMLMCVEHNISLGLVTGDSGTGKSLLGQRLLVGLNESKYQTALVLVTPGMTRTNFLKELCFELTGDENVFDIRDSHTVLKHIQNEVIELYEKDKKAVIIIDEAHFLSSNALHILRTLSNIEIPEKKLITCILLAESSFLRRLRHSSYKSLDSRMYVRESIMPLSSSEIEQYVKFRIAAAGGNVEIVDDDAYEVIAEKSKGLLRQNNKIMTLALMNAFFASHRSITSDMIRSIQD
ncbi:MAG: AAA family ATPase [Candidatus Aureabacteria bacterium]|nr:AAA family ATPase [Candidatus Auribacterota bacterium]